MKPSSPIFGNELVREGLVRGPSPRRAASPRSRANSRPGFGSPFARRSNRSPWRRYRSRPSRKTPLVSDDLPARRFADLPERRACPRQREPRDRKGRLRLSGRSLGHREIQSAPPALSRSAADGRRDHRRRHPRRSPAAQRASRRCAATSASSSKTSSCSSTRRSGRTSRSRCKSPARTRATSCDRCRACSISSASRTRAACIPASFRAASSSAPRSRERSSTTRRFCSATSPPGIWTPSNTTEIMELLLRINLKGTTVVVATHNQAVVDRMRRRVVRLDDGRIIDGRGARLLLSWTGARSSSFWVRCCATSRATPACRPRRSARSPSPSSCSGSFLFVRAALADVGATCSIRSRFRRI